MHRRAMMAGLGASALAAAGGSAAKDKGVNGGAQGVTGTATSNYAATGAHGELTLADIARMPTTGLAPLPFELKPANAKFFKGKTKVALVTYGLGIVRAGTATAYSGGFGSAVVSRRATIQTGLVGVSDELGAQLAEEGYADLVSRLKAGGYEVLAPDVVQASAISKIGALPSPTKGVNGWSIYGPAAAPLRAGTFFTSNGLGGLGAFGPLGDAAKALDAIVLSPSMVVDYEWLASSGSHNFGNRAEVGANLRFHAVQNSGAQFTVTPAPPYKGGWAGSFLQQQGTGTDEPFGVMYEVDDRSDNRALATAMALAGFANMYRQKKIYAVEVVPDRYAALTRAAYQCLNLAIVESIRRAATA